MPYAKIMQLNIYTCVWKKNFWNTKMLTVILCRWKKYWGMRLSLVFSFILIHSSQSAQCFDALK